MVMRTVFDPIKASSKLNSTHANKPLPLDTISWELLLLASSLLTNQHYIFESESTGSANQLLLDYMDTITIAGKIPFRINDIFLLFNVCPLASVWNDLDPWISARFSKTHELVARLAAQLAHIDTSMSLLQAFVLEKRITDCQASVSIEKYFELKAFIYSRHPSSRGLIVINRKCCLSVRNVEG